MLKCSLNSYTHFGYLVTIGYHTTAMETSHEDRRHRRLRQCRLAHHRRNWPAAATRSPPSPATPKRSRGCPTSRRQAGDVMDQAGAARSFCRAMTWRSVPSTSWTSDPAKLIAAAKASGVGRYLVVGGAGSLEVAPGVRLVTTPNFPAQYKAEAERAAPSSTCSGRKGAELDLPVALGPVRPGRADRQVPARDRPASDRRRRQKLDHL